MENTKNKAKDHKGLQGAEQIYQRLTDIPVSKGLKLEPDSIAGRLSLKACVFEQAVFLRVKELAGVAIELYRQHKLVSAVVITRSLFETVALYHYLYTYLEEAIETRSLGRAAKVLLKASMGWRKKDIPVQAVNVLTTISKLHKKFGHVMPLYEDLCEMAHPNWMGCEGAFAKLNQQNDCIKFTENYEHVPQGTGLPAFEAALAVFEHCYNEMADVLSKFAELCKETSKQEGDSANTSEE